MDYSQLAAVMDGYSGDDVANVCRDAAMNGMRQAIAGKTPEQIRCAAQTAMRSTMHMHMHVPQMGASCMLVIIWQYSEQARSSSGCSSSRRDKLLGVALPGHPK